MTNKKLELFKFIKEWENKDYNEFTNNFEGIVEKLKLSYDNAKEISDALEAESYKEGVPNSGSEYLQ